MAAQRKMTFGVIVGNRGFFPTTWPRPGAKKSSRFSRPRAHARSCSARKNQNTARLKRTTEAQRCAELFKKHAEEIDGIIVTLPNFGEERGIVDAIRLSGLKVPVLVQATPDRSEAMTIATRRDSFCGKMRRATT